MFRTTAAILLTVAAVHGQESKESPLGLVLEAKGQLLRAGSELALAAKPGDILFAGDSLRGEAAFVYCPDKSGHTVPAGGDVLFEPKQLRVRAGALGAKSTVGGCFLPPMSRTIIASQQHSGTRSTAAAATVPLAERIQTLPEPQRKALLAALEPVERAIAANPRDMIARLQRVAVLESQNLKQDAADEARTIAREWPDAAWMKSRLFSLEEEAAPKAATGAATAAEPEGKTYALLVGISDFKDPRIDDLRFAHQDAISLAELLRSARAGSLPEEDVVVLANEKATVAAIRAAIDTSLKARAGPNDTILLFIASHGTVVEDARKKQQGYILTHDTSPEDLATTALPMSDVRKLFEEELGNVRRLLLYVDVCRAGKIGQVAPAEDKTNREAGKLAPEDKLFGLLAAQKGQVAYEGVQYGGGHGAFSYFLLDALNGSADFNQNGTVTMDEFAQYVQDKVRDSTSGKQIPKPIGDIDEKRVMAQTGKQGIALQPFSPEMAMRAGRGGTDGARGTALITPLATVAPLILRSSELRYRGAADLVKQLDEAIASGRILPGDDRNAFSYLGALKFRLTPDLYVLEADKLRVALEDRGQQVLLRYLTGDEMAQDRADFLAGAAYFDAAEPLARDSLLLQSRSLFCQGRVALFDKNYPRAADLLERAIRLDPERAYAYNARGIAYLERADYPQAILAFREAARRASYWAYPLHNMALAQTESGDYAGAIRSYEQAIRLAPRYSYLPYNLGLVYQRMNRRRDAEGAYRQAMALAPASALPYNALGLLKAESGKFDEAERLYRQALEKDAKLLAARHNLALLLSSRPDRAAEAFRLWRENLAGPSPYFPSRLSLARALARTGDNAGAVAEYNEVLKAKPDYLAARLALAEVYAKSNERDSALAQLRDALRLDAENPDVHERIGDLERAAGRASEASAAYRKALEHASDGGSKKRIRRKIG